MFPIFLWDCLFFLTDLKEYFIYIYIYFFFFNKFTYFWLRWVFVAAQRAFSSCGEQGLLFVAVCGLLIAVASLVEEHRL